MIRADLRILLTSAAYPDERASFRGLDPAGQRWGFRGRVFFADGRNTVYRDADGNLYSVPTAD